MNEEEIIAKIEQSINTVSQAEGILSSMKETIRLHDAQLKEVRALLLQGIENPHLSPEQAHSLLRDIADTLNIALP